MDMIFGYQNVTYRLLFHVDDIVGIQIYHRAWSSIVSVGLCTLDKHKSQIMKHTELRNVQNQVILEIEFI